MADEELLVDPDVSGAKFAREVDQYLENAREHRRKGVLLIEAEYPNVVLTFGAPQLKPAPIVFGAVVNFANYDLWAPSVQFINPFTGEPAKHRDMLTHFHRKQTAVVPEAFANAGINIDAPPQPLLMAVNGDSDPFICIPGVREYHDNPGHSGDSWLLHRQRGEGTLHFIVTQLHRYGVEPLRGFQFGIVVTGLTQPQAPD